MYAKTRIAFFLTMLATFTFPGFAADAPTEEKIDWDKARKIHHKETSGQSLTAEESTFLQHAKEVRQKMMQEGRNPEPNAPAGNGQGRAGGGPVAPAKEFTGMVPLTQFKGDAKYKGEDGGLYGGGSNVPPADHLRAAMEQSRKVVPLGPDGKPAVDGKIALLSIGMSNTTMEFSKFKEIADADPAKNGKLVIVDGAQGGKEATAWSGRVPERAKGVWETVDRRIAAAGVTPAQVQVLYIKQAIAGPSLLGEFPKHARQLETDLQVFLNRARQKWPNVRLAYLSSRIYAGYASTPLNPEPYAYEGAFSMRWLIQDQIKGDPKLNYDPVKGPVTSPLLLWGPYLWADGVKGRDGDDLVYKREDLGPDGTHPSPTGRQKVADLLLKFIKTDPTAKPWFLKESKAE